jgi:hypothetical protein
MHAGYSHALCFTNHSRKVPSAGAHLISEHHRVRGAGESSDKTYARMIHYTDRLADLMRDIVSRVPTLSFIDMSGVFVFARFGRAGYAGPFATCHCLSLPDTEPGYYFWRDRTTGRVTRRSEWFVTKSPLVSLAGRDVKYLISFTIPRFCDQSLNRSRKERFYRRATDGWVAKLDTVVHELYHIDPEHHGIRRLDRSDGTCASNAHSPQFFADVAEMVSQYLDSKPNPAMYDFLMDDFDGLRVKHGTIVGSSFRPFPSYPQRFQERLEPQPVVTDPELAEVAVEPWRATARRVRYTSEHLHDREFFREASRVVQPKRDVRAA